MQVVMAPMAMSSAIKEDIVSEMQFISKTHVTIYSENGRFLMYIKTTSSV
jgi:hypothetical protein